MSTADSHWSTVSAAVALEIVDEDWGTIAARWSYWRPIHGEMY